jgi:hypothetical protein
MNRNGLKLMQKISWRVFIVAAHSQRDMLQLCEISSSYLPLECQAGSRVYGKESISSNGPCRDGNKHLHSNQSMG